MQDIEPELTSTMLSKLDAMYQNETEDEHSVRMQRYAQALETYAKRCTLFFAEMKMYAKNVRKAALHSAEMDDRTETLLTLYKLNSSISQ